MKLGIIGAMDLETEILKSKMKVENTVEMAGMTYYTGTLHDKAVVVVTCGIGKVNAAACSQILISNFKVDAIVNTGVSGAIHDDLNVGDIVISTDCMEHDVDCTGFGYEYGVIPQMETSTFVANPYLVDLAYNSSIEEIKTHKIFKGRIVSGDQFVSSVERKEFIETTFGAHTTEMEGASIAHVCHLNKLPFVIIRSMSDKADGSAHVNYAEFAKEAAKNSTQIIINMVIHMKSEL